ncbi:MAG: molybdopterin-dependent oxidoreductase [Micrococcales bacterium]|nr:molybdopterin-dependent oxidoreductase [Micrococcales bacterium]
MRLLAAGAGVVAVATGLGLGALVAALVAPDANPVLAVGSLLIDLSPGPVKKFFIGLFGTFDKTALLILIGVLLLVLAGIAGALERRRPPLGRILIGLGAALGLVAAVSRATAAPLAAAPALVTGLAAILLLPALLRRAPEAPDAPGADGRPARRAFLQWSLGSLALGGIAALGGVALTAKDRTVAAARKALRLPAPAVAAPPLPAGADLRIPGLARIVSSNSGFYRIDTALQVPQIDPDDWALEITGMVQKTVRVTWQDLLALPLEEYYATLMCVSNPVGGDLIGNARWLGYPVRNLLERAGPSSRADMVLSSSTDGFTVGTPLEALLDEQRNAILAVGMNGQPLPPEHGFPVRMIVPGLYGYVSATKWVVKLEVTRFDRAQAYWTRQGWGERGPIKLQSRIDTVRRIDGGDWVIAGVAWRQFVGVRGVQVQVDGGSWQDAQLSAPISVNTWVQWRLPWRPASGSHTVAVRAIGADGEVQTAKVADVLPDGATGYHKVTLTV